MKPKEYEVLQMAVRDGVDFGWTRAHKHVDTPTTGQIMDHITREVLSEVCRWFDFEDVEAA